ncbi:MAG: hypothetical protein Q9225_001281 [Loekoesia sp. 1 TL-2023]
MDSPAPASIADAPIENFGYASKTGYARSKLVGEHIVRNAARVGARSYTLRIGQVVGDMQHGVWNDKDFIPMMIRSALTLKTLPNLQERCSWLPVDTLATTILELAVTHVMGPKHKPCAFCDFFESPSNHSNEASVLYNIVNPYTFSWEDLLKELHASGLEFTTVTFPEWLQMLRDSAAKGDDESRNPAVKLVDYFGKTYRGEESSPGGDVTFDTVRAQRDSAALMSAPRLFEEGHVRKFLGQWLRRWK